MPTSSSTPERMRAPLMEALITWASALVPEPGLKIRILAGQLVGKRTSARRSAEEIKPRLLVSRNGTDGCTGYRITLNPSIRSAGVQVNGPSVHLAENDTFKCMVWDMSHANMRNIPQIFLRSPIP